MDILKYSSMLQDNMDIRWHCNCNQSVSILNGGMTQNSSEKNQGISVKIFRNGVHGFASSSDTDHNTICRVVKAAQENAALLDSKIGRSITLPKQVNLNIPLYYEIKRIDQRYIIDIAKEIDAYIINNYPNLKSRTIIITNESTEKKLLTANVKSHTFRPRAVFHLSMTTNDKTGLPVTYENHLGEFGMIDEQFEDKEKLYSLVDQTYESLMQKKEGGLAEGGFKQVILSPDLAGILMHEAIGHAVESDSFQANSIAYTMRDKLCTSELITLVDLANTYNGETLPVPIYVDDEGTKAEDVTIISNGVMKDFLYNRKLAVEYNGTPKGNARASEYSDIPLVRMRNTLLLPGENTIEEMIASVDDGYYFMMPTNGQADLNSEFMFGVNMGYEIKNGKLSRPIRDTTISGKAFDVLSTVTMVGNKISWSGAGYCGKNQWIPVSMGGPAIKCMMQVGGK
ncbi:TldD protein [Anaerosporobacter mobilis DSM 15930]|uniref:TldD protein n=1 Tax=Anaerosporobacter mobilis DSM 15930 TaxID=1120996 RepID=A0A1M7I6L1_9FIRM|nr:TldD/PmbA family protein [Anaerosporobacter mobilis]SHM36077.1 TldD protein [Anaerosporobacter mobilis DSM 15930]